MRWFLSLGAALLFLVASQPVQAQRGGTVYRDPRTGATKVVVPARPKAEFETVPRFHELDRDRHSSRHPDELRFGDPRMRQVAAWYRQFFGREMVLAEMANWQDHFRRGGSLDEILVSLLGSRDYYLQAGGQFESWLSAVADATDVRLRRDEYPLWHDAYHREPDRFSFTKRFLTTKGVLGRKDQVVSGYRPGLSGHDILDLNHDPYVRPGHDHAHDQDHYGTGPAPPYVGPAGPGYAPVPGYAPDYVSDPRYSQHTTGYRPLPVAQSSPPELISGWYRQFFGREIAPQELNKWLSDIDKGMALDEVYASVLAAPEWYARAGSNTPRWIIATLEAHGERADQSALDHWMKRFDRNKGDRYKTALEMVKSFNRRR